MNKYKLHLKLLERGTPPAVATTWQALLWNRLTLKGLVAIGQFLNWLGLPGFIKPIETYDQLTDTSIKVQISDLFTIISIDGRDFYFNRRSGKYDGSGMAVSDK